MKKAARFIFPGILLIFVILIFLLRTAALTAVGSFLMSNDLPKKADAIVILRGDGNYARSTEAVSLFKNGFANKIILSRSLKDKAVARLKRIDVSIPTNRDDIVSIFDQSGIPRESLILDSQEPGGGTWGELQRVKSVLEEKGYTRVLIVTSWFHTKRTRLMCDKIFDKGKIDYSVLAAADDVSSPSNWWRYRYEAISVLEEYPKLFFFHLSSVFKMSFQDDPKRPPKGSKASRL